MNHSTSPDERSRNFWTPLRTMLTLSALFLLATFTVASCSKPANTANDSGTPNATMTVNGANASAPVKNNTAPPMPSVLPDKALNTELETIDGKAFKLADLKGKVLVIDLWATWCVPCRNSTPELVNLQKEFGPRGFEVIGLDIDPDSDSPEDVKAFADEFKINYKLAFADRELAMSIMRGGNIPQSIVIGRDGKIVEHFIGFNPVRTPEKLRAAIEKAIQ
jgi:thiol-disulfide isomerase/thioredoxin